MKDMTNEVFQPSLFGGLDQKGLAPRFASPVLQFSGDGAGVIGRADEFTGLKSFTLETWVRLDPPPQDRPWVGPMAIVGSMILDPGGRTSNAKPGVSLFVDRDRRLISAFPTLENSVTWSKQPLDLGAWYYVATAYDSGTQELSLYVNGFLVETKKVASPAGIVHKDPFKLGFTAYSDGNVVWKLRGQIGRTMLWSTVRSAEDILKDANRSTALGPAADPGLRAYVDPSSMPLIDQSGNGVRAELFPGATFGMAVPGALLGGQGAIRVAASRWPQKLDLTGSFTIEGWFYPFGSGTIVSRSAGSSGYRVAYEDRRLVFERSGERVVSSQILDPNVYYHFAAVYDDDQKQMSLWVYGNLLVTASVAQALSPSGADLWIGATDGRSSLLQAHVQNLRLWRVALSRSEIRQWMYNQPVLTPSLAASFDFDVSPPVDSSTGLTPEAGPGVTVGYISLDVDRDAPVARVGLPEVVNSEYLNPEAEPPLPPPPPVQLSAADAQALEEELERARRVLRAAGLPEHPFTTTRCDGCVRIVYHGVDGEVLVYSGEEVSDCLLWWMQFTFMLTIGFFQALGLAPSTGDILSRVYNLLRSNPRVVAAMTSLAGKAITAGAALGIMGVVWREGLLWPLLKMVLTAAGWWTLVWVLKQAIAVLTGLEAAAVLAGFIGWAAQLTVHSAGYRSACPSFADGPPREGPCRCERCGGWKGDRPERSLRGETATPSLGAGGWSASEPQPIRVRESSSEPGQEWSRRDPEAPSPQRYEDGRVTKAGAGFCDRCGRSYEKSYEPADEPAVSWRRGELAFGAR